MLLIAPVSGIFKNGFQFCFIAVVSYTSSTMVKMQMREEHIRDIVSRESFLFQRAFQRFAAMQIIMRKEFCILFVANAIVDQYQPVSVFNKQTAQCPVAHVVLIGSIGFAPKRFGYHAKHG